MSNTYTTAVLHARIFYDTLISMLSLLVGGLLPNLTVPSKNLTGKVAIVTGTNSRIGYQLALDLATSGATVYLACATRRKARKPSLPSVQLSHERTRRGSGL